MSINCSIAINASFLFLKEKDIHKHLDDVANKILKSPPKEKNLPDIGTYTNQL